MGHQEVHVLKTLPALLEETFELFISYLILYNIFLILIEEHLNIVVSVRVPEVVLLELSRVLFLFFTAFVVRIQESHNYLALIY